MVGHVDGKMSLHSVGHVITAQKGHIPNVAERQEEGDRENYV